MKTCSKCGAEKGLDEFVKRSDRRSGVRGYCKECQSAARRNDIEKFREQERQSRHRNRAKRNAQSRKYHAENAERRSTERKDYWSAYRADSPVAWANTYRRRAEHHGITPVVEDIVRVDVIEKYGDSCVYCGGEFQDLDHYVPISKGGSHTLDNVRPSCRSCNSSKRNRDPEDFIEARCSR